MSEPQRDLAALAVPVRRPRGRPRAEERLVTVSFRCNESEYDRLIRVASRRREDVSPLLRSLLKLRLPRK